MTEVIQLQKHIKYIVNSWKCFPDFYINSESNRQTLLFFIVGSLDILNELETTFSVKERSEIINWIYSLQVMYCEPEFPDYGATSYAWKGFGGLLFSSNGKLFPRYNLEAGWKRRLTPSSGIDQGLLFGCCAETRYRYRIPGHYRHDVEPAAVLNRNLICIDSLPGELNVVKEHSDRKIVEAYSVQTLGSLNSFPSFLRHCDPDPNYTYKFDEQISELRTSTDADVWNFFVRCRSKFHVVDRNKKSHEIFKGNIISWEQNHHIPEEIAIVGRDRMLWSGVIGQTFGRTKTTGIKAIRAITYSDHPRVLLAVDEHDIRTLDVRCDTQATSNLLFSSSQFSEELYKMKTYRSREPLEEPTWTHIKALPNQTHSFLAISTYSIFLLDDRVPGKFVLSNNHSLLDGAHLLVAGRPIDDLDGSGQIQSFYLLDQFATGLWKMDIYKHRSEDWSSIKPLHGVPDPNDRKFILRKRIAGDNNYVHPPTRGIAVLSEIDGTLPKEILFRYMDDSSVMYRTYYYGTNIKEEKEMESACLERTTFWEKEKQEIEAEELMDTFGEGIMKPPVERCKSIDVQVEIPPKRYHIPCPLHPLTKEVAATAPLQPLQPNCTLKGFRGSHSLSGIDGSPPPGTGDGAQLSQTYSALCSLVILGDDLSRVDRGAILSRIKESQNEDGSFWSQGEGSECDMRYVFIAVAICHILKDDSVIDWNRLKKFMRQALRYDGGIGQGYDDESHGGSTYCAIAALALSNRLWNYEVYSEKEIRKLIKWAVYKQDEGMHGRAHKEDDCCYAFWIGATLNILNAQEFLDLPRLRRFLCNAQHKKWGGFCKLITTEYSDILHTYFSLAALSLMREATFTPMNPALNLTRRAYEHLSHVQSNFK